MSPEATHTLKGPDSPLQAPPPCREQPTALFPRFSDTRRCQKSPPGAPWGTAGPRALPTALKETHARFQALGVSGAHSLPGHSTHMPLILADRTPSDTASCSTEENPVPSPALSPHDKCLRHSLRSRPAAARLSVSVSASLCCSPACGLHASLGSAPPGHPPGSGQSAILDQRPEVSAAGQESGWQGHHVPSGGSRRKPEPASPRG